MRLLNWLFRFGTLAAMALLISTCGNGGTGTLSLNLTDADNEDFKAVYVTINEIQVHSKEQPGNSEEGWLSLPDFEGPRTINLLDLQNGVVTGLGRIELETGEYTQLRASDHQPFGPPEWCCHWFGAHRT
jgi:hypothetical protein